MLPFMMKEILLLLTSYLLLSAEASSSKGVERQLLLGNEKASLGYNDLFSPEDYRQSFCEQYQLASNNSGGIGKSLSGSRINVLVQSEEGLGDFNYNEETGINPRGGGYYADILDYIGDADRGNFTWRQSFGVLNSPKSRNDSSYTKQLEWGTDNYDIFVSEWGVTHERMDLSISFTSEVSHANIIMVRNKIPEEDQQIIQWFFIMLPFTNAVWWMLIAQTIFSAFVYQFLQFFGNERNGRSIRNWTVNSLYMISVSFSGSNWHFPSETTWALRLFSFSFALYILFVTKLYGANLTSYIVGRSRSGFVLNTIDDAVDHSMNVCIEGGTNEEEYIINNYPQAIPLLVPQRSVNDMYTALIDGECDVLLGKRSTFELYKLSKEFNPDCHLTWEGRVVYDANQAFATHLDPGIKCSLLVNEVFTIYLDAMAKDGILDKLWEKKIKSQATRKFCDEADKSADDKTSRRYLQSNSNQDNTDGEGDVTSSVENEINNDTTTNDENDYGSSLETSYAASMTLAQMAGVFLLHLILSIVAMIVGVFSWYMKKKKYDDKGNDMKSNHDDSLLVEANTNTNKMAQDQINQFATNLEQLDNKIDLLLSMMEKTNTE